MDAAAAAQRIRGRLGLQRVSLSPAMLVLLGLVAVGAALRLYLLAGKSIWLDEAFSIVISQRDPAELLRMVARTDAHPPLYYLALNLWLSLVGTGAGRVRLLSALFSTASIPLMYLVGESLYQDAQAGLIAAAVLAFSPFQVWYGQEARMYAMLTILVLASACFFLRALRRNSPLDWAGFALTTVLALYTDTGALWYVFGLGLFYLLFARRFPGTLKDWILSQVAIALLYAPWLPFFWKQTGLVAEGFWLPPPSFQAVLGTFLDFNSLGFPWLALNVLYMAFIFVLAYIVPDREGWQRPLATFWLFAPLGLSLLLSLRQPIFLSRNLIAASLGYYLLVAGTIRRFRSPKAATALLLPLVAMNLVSVGHNAWYGENEDWREAAEYVAEAAEDTESGLLFFVPGYAELPFQYYFGQYDLDLDTQGYPEDEVLLYADPRRVEDVASSVGEQPYVWLVLRNAELVDPDWVVKGWMDSHGYVRTGDLVREKLSVISYVQWDYFYTEFSFLPLVMSEAELSATAEGAAPEQEPRVHEAPTPGEPAVPDQGRRVHVVQAGETLWEIAVQYGTTVQDLVEANDIANPTLIRPGQKLIVP